MGAAASAQERATASGMARLAGAAAAVYRLGAGLLGARGPSMKRGGLTGSARGCRGAEGGDGGWSPMRACCCRAPEVRVCMFMP